MRLWRLIRSRYKGGWGSTPSRTRRLLSTSIGAWRRSLPPNLVCWLLFVGSLDPAAKHPIERLGVLEVREMASPRQDREARGRHFGRGLPGIGQREVVSLAPHEQSGGGDLVQASPHLVAGLGLVNRHAAVDLELKACGPGPARGFQRVIERGLAVRDAIWVDGEAPNRALQPPARRPGGGCEAP